MNFRADRKLWYNILMLILSMFGWWYAAGLREQLNRIKRMFVRVNDQFSIPLLAKTLFQPFRQISVGTVDGALEDKIRAWLDRVVSRLIGGFIRIMTMVVGLIALAGTAVVSLIMLAVWIAMPLLPFIGIIIMVYVGIPWENVGVPWI